MPGLGVSMAAGRRVRMLASVADQDRAIRILQASFVEGRLARDEFEQRVGLAIVSRDFRELLALTADLPAARSTGCRRTGSPRARRRAGNRGAGLPGWHGDRHEPARRGQLIRRRAIRPSRSSKFIGPVPLKPSPVTVRVTM